MVVSVEKEGIRMIRKNYCGNITDEVFLNIIIPFDKRLINI